MGVPRNFTFRLQKLKAAREIREQQEQAKLLSLQLALQQQQAALQTMLDREQEVVDEMTAPDGGIFDPDGRLSRERWLVRFRQDIEVQRGKVTDAHSKVAAQEIVLKKARQDVKVLEKLEEKQREEWHKELLSEQAIFLDDLSSQQYIRQTKTRSQLLEEQEQAAQEAQA